MNNNVEFKYDPAGVEAARVEVDDLASQIAEVKRRAAEIRAEAEAGAPLKAGHPGIGHTGHLQPYNYVTVGGVPGAFCDLVGACKECAEFARAIASSGGIVAVIPDDTSIPPSGGAASIPADEWGHLDTSTEPAWPVEVLRAAAAGAVYKQIIALAGVTPGASTPKELGGVWDVEDANLATKAIARLVPAVAYLDPTATAERARGLHFDFGNAIHLDGDDDDDQGLTEFGAGFAGDDDDDDDDDDDTPETPDPRQGRLALAGDDDGVPF